jgi:hypothetical protein
MFGIARRVMPVWQECPSYAQAVRRAFLPDTPARRDSVRIGSAKTGRNARPTRPGHTKTHTLQPPRGLTTKAQIRKGQGTAGQSPARRLQRLPRLQRRERHTKGKGFGRKLILRQHAGATRTGTNTALTMIQIERDAALTD